MNPPKCRACWKEVVSADAGLLRSIPYWYCKACKVEVDGNGREVRPESEHRQSVTELDDYLSGEMGRFDNESPSGDDYGSGLISLYDPFHKRNRKIALKDAKDISNVFSVKPRVDEEDDEILGFWNPDFLPESI